MSKANKVKPQSGQVWKAELNIVGMTERTIRGIIDGEPYHPDVYFTCGNHTKRLWNKWEFVPQNKLEQLAVDYSYWGRIPAGLCKLADADFSKWQECRYKLGLDDRPQQEVNVMKIDLSGAVVGEQFECETGSVFTVAIKTKFNLAITADDSGCVFACDFGGIFSCSYKDIGQIVKKHDPRPWLKDLPDASVFRLFNIVEISCSHTGEWEATYDTGACVRMNSENMPDLTSDQIKLSEMSIADLTKWQSENK